MQEVDYEQATKLLEMTNGILLDVRSYQEYYEEHLQNAININLYNLEKDIQYIIPNKQTFIIVYCTYGNRSTQAQQILQNLGYKNVYNLKNGMYYRSKK